MGHISFWSVLMMLGENINIIKRNRKGVLEASEEGWSKNKCTKSKYVFMSCHQSAAQIII
jgi:hypothetical protein